MNNPVCVSEIFSSIQGEGLLAGRRQVFIRLSECNLECEYCDTDHARRDTCRVETVPGSGRSELLPNPLPLPRVLQLIQGWCDASPGAHHSISLTGGEPLLYGEALAAWLPALRQLLPIHLETNGTMCLALEQVVSQLHYVSMDMKLPSTSGCTEHLWDLHREFLRIAVGHNASVKVVVDDRTTVDEILQVCDIILGIDAVTPLFIQPRSRIDVPGVAINASHLLLLQETAACRIPDVRVIPQMHRMLGVA